MFISLDGMVIFAGKESEHCNYLPTSLPLGVHVSCLFRICWLSYKREYFQSCYACKHLFWNIVLIRILTIVCFACKLTDFFFMVTGLIARPSWIISYLSNTNLWAPLQARSSHTHISCRVTTRADGVSIRRVLLLLLQGQHVQSQYWTGDARWHSAKVNVVMKYNRFPLNKKCSSSAAAAGAGS